MKKSARWLGLLCAVGVGFVVVSCDEEAPMGVTEATTPTITETAATPLFDFHEPVIGDCLNEDPDGAPNKDYVRFNNATCTANDVEIKVLQVVSVDGDPHDPATPIECVEGAQLEVGVIAFFGLNAEERYDISYYLAEDGGDAKRGTCFHGFLDPIENGGNGDPTGGPPFDGPYYNYELAEDPADICGDAAENDEVSIPGVADGIAAVVEVPETITLFCQDPVTIEGKQFLEFGTCTAWDINKSNGDKKPSCESVEDAVPGTPAKCNCDPAFLEVVILAQLTLEKEVINDNGGTASDTAWTLTGTGDQTPTPDVITGKEGDASITNAEVLAGTYTLSESAVTDYSQKGNWVCTGDGSFTSPDQITLAPGDAATCVVTNDDDPIFLTLKKDVINDHGGTAKDTAWTLTGTGDQATPKVITGKEGDTSITNAEVLVGTYVLSESSVSGYSQKGDWKCTGTGTFAAPDTIKLGLGESAECVVTNDDDPPGLTLLKKVINDDGGTAADTAWTLCFTNGSSACGVEGDSAITNAPVIQGTYTLSEKDGPANYSSDGVWSCTGGSFTSPNKIAVGLGESATCEITNDDDKPKLTLLKKVINDHGGTAADTAWTLCFTNGSNACGIEGGAAITNAAVKGGTYTLSEKDGPANYSSTGVWACTGDGSYTSPDKIALASGQSASCEITNDDDPSKLTLLKKVINDDGGTAADTAWTLCFTNGSSACGVEGGAAITNAAVIAGTYTLSEKDGPTNYSSTGVWACTGGTFTSPDKIAVGIGQSATCEITNDDDKPKLTLLKKVINDNGGGAADTAWTLSFTGPSNGSGVEGAAAITNAVVNGGTYTMSESGGPDFYTTDGVWVCTGTGTPTSPDKINLVSGQSASCEITNDDVERCAPGDRLTSVTLKVNSASPDPLSMQITDDSGNLSNAAILQTEDPAGTGHVFTVTPEGGATFFDSQNLRFYLGPVGGPTEASKDLKVHLSCSDDPYIGQTHSGSADGFSATLEKVSFVTTQF